MSECLAHCASYCAFVRALTDQHAGAGKQEPKPKPRFFLQNWTESDRKLKIQNRNNTNQIIHFNIISLSYKTYKVINDATLTIIHTHLSFEPSGRMNLGTSTNNLRPITTVSQTKVTASHTLTFTDSCHPFFLTSQPFTAGFSSLFRHPSKSISLTGGTVMSPTPLPSVLWADTCTAWDTSGAIPRPCTQLFTKLRHRHQPRQHRRQATVIKGTKIHQLSREVAKRVTISYKHTFPFTLTLWQGIRLPASLAHGVRYHRRERTKFD